MTKPLPLQIHSQTLWASAGRSLYWEEDASLIVSDLHFGKTGHFRKSGIPVPPKVNREDLQRLVVELVYFGARKLILTGDLFHSEENLEWDHFRRWRDSLPVEEFILVRGNHDILKTPAYASMGIRVQEKSLSMNPFRFTHDPQEQSDASRDLYTIAGHWHPGIRLTGMGKQSLRLPCFYFTQKWGVLPAFSRFSGLAQVEPAQAKHVIAILPAEPRSGGSPSLIALK
ncbi:MAG: ligase-associated DNA damage response endonuclease PdeM [Bacteroidetes bacterium]|nr:ligase-associated DNA damage response endonuclease PdeM [Bacteroidota bacterium]